MTRRHSASVYSQVAWPARRYPALLTGMSRPAPRIHDARDAGHDRLIGDVDPDRYSDVAPTREAAAADTAGSSTSNSATRAPSATNRCAMRAPIRGPPQ
jgi:hypothetical protein